MVNNLPSNAGYVGLISGWGTKIPHVAGHLSPCTTVRETCLPPRRAHLLQQRTSTAKRKKEKAEKKKSVLPSRSLKVSPKGVAAITM